MEIKLDKDGNERELLSCPFCNNPDISKIFHRNYSKIGCADCEIFLELNGRTFKTIAEARTYYEPLLTEKWNTRY